MPQVSSGSFVTLQRQEVRNRADLIVTFIGGPEEVPVVVVGVGLVVMVEDIAVDTLPGWR